MINQEIIFLKGLPASGKTTWAKQFCNSDPNYIRINKDDIRELLGNQKYNYEFEELVLKIQRFIGVSILNYGKSIVVDDTNFSPKHKQYWEQVSKDKNCKFIIKFFDIPLQECIERDFKRGKGCVGPKVITDMYNKYLKE